MSPPDQERFTLDQNILHRLDQLDRVSVRVAEPRLKLGLTMNQAEPIQSPSNPLDPDDISATGVHAIRAGDDMIWLSGSALLCRCPDCSAPMTIRVWLQLADCWRCPTSIMLSEAQMAAAARLRPNRNSDSPVQPPQPRLDAIPLPAPGRPQTADPAGSVSTQPVGQEQELERLSRQSSVAWLLRRGFSNLPAWLVSFLLHLVVILILALVLLGDRGFLESSITLSTFLSKDDQIGGDLRVEIPTNALQDDLALASRMDVEDRELRDVLQKANLDARELQVDPQPVSPLPDLTEVKRNITTAQGNLMSFAARDPRVRADMVRQQGGTTITEAAVSRGLRWLASVQNQDGGWSLTNYRDHDKKSNPSDVMGTSLALLPMLGAGQTHEFGAYKQNVARGLAWLLKYQKTNGDLRAGYDGNPGMYAHGQATIVLCEVLALTGDQQFVEPAQRAIEFIEAAQHGKGGWRYRPGQPGDTSVFGWQMMALQSARASGADLAIDDNTLKLADYFLDQVTAPASFNNRRSTQLPDGSAYAYQPGREATPAMTAEAILCRMYLGWKKNDPRLDSAIKWLITNHLPNKRDRNLYYWYYGTQVMHHYGGKPWEIWNNKMRELLISTQQTGGMDPGSWSPMEFEWGPQGGRIYTTSLAVCTLEVYYRHLPIFHQINLDR